MVSARVGASVVTGIISLSFFHSFLLRSWFDLVGEGVRALQRPTAGMFMFIIIWYILVSSTSNFDMLINSNHLTFILPT
jgi:hypothetical protein